MDSRTADYRSRGTCCEAGGSRHNPEGLCVHHGILELSDVAPDCVGHLAPSAATSQIRCRQILVELLAPIGAEAGDWADSLVDRFGSLAAVLAADASALARTVHDAAAVRHLRVVRAAMLQALKTEAMSGPVLSNSEVLIDYLFADMAYL